MKVDFPINCFPTNQLSIGLLKLKINIYLRKTEKIEKFFTIINPDILII